MKPSQPYQPLLLRILHGLNGLFLIAAILTAFWTYDTYDGRWGRIPLPQYKDIEGIHGTFGLYTLAIFPLFVLYAFHRGQKRLVQQDSFSKLTQVKQPIWWYTLHRFANTFSLLALTFALFSGKMMDEKWLPQGELNHFWYYAHLLSWVVMVVAIALHLLMSVKIGGTPLLLSVLQIEFRPNDSPALWREHFKQWRQDWRFNSLLGWFNSLSVPKVLEVFILGSIVLAWVISLIKETLLS